MRSRKGKFDGMAQDDAELSSLKFMIAPRGSVEYHGKAKDVLIQ